MDAVLSALGSPVAVGAMGVTVKLVISPSS